MSNCGISSQESGNKTSQQPTKQVKKTNSDLSSDNSVHDNSVTIHEVQMHDIEKLVQSTVSRIVETIEKI